ncbi:hypothetical protein AGABI1DRAFT_135188 [Agaricus bisporus var. burnettii JB137-S8]|uniref:Uncharacterized protein n=1 Tax=Agaricus bisporus var. burnettii (strain JB137-S8 / ATCC MYA-4627 / FGSC 10392) TaxID=597362 RepID=K5XFW4_AGABU|nr:uncharacterized protein AGABI1DRAFT_135188 [Agaricus bisporus var. burnettii JB137-S8]EKM73270.1 hypothetical protein AGABI1DRAFT_135188 [Agaricus bisporus var. burnettii JB137-S8]
MTRSPSSDIILEHSEDSGSGIFIAASRVLNSSETAYIILKPLLVTQQSIPFIVSLHEGSLAPIWENCTIRETIAFSYDEHRSSYNEPLHVDQAKPWPVVE